MKRSLAIIFPFVVLASTNAHSYELGTHARVTQAAYGASALNDVNILKAMGIQPADPAPFGAIYYDVFGSETKERQRNAFEADFMPSGTLVLSVQGWLLRGAIREDDLGTVLRIPIGPDPHDDPYGNIFRVFNHFYDPIYDRGLTRIITLGQKSPDWAIGAIDAFAQPVVAASNRRNHFTVFDAREAMYRALTGKNKANLNIATTKGRAE